MLADNASSQAGCLDARSPAAPLGRREATYVTRQAEIPLETSDACVSDAERRGEVGKKGLRCQRAQCSMKASVATGRGTGTDFVRSRKQRRYM